MREEGRKERRKEGSTYRAIAIYSDCSATYIPGQILLPNPNTPNLYVCSLGSVTFRNLSGLNASPSGNTAGSLIIILRGFIFVNHSTDG
jgi:hypothetical protein